MKTFRISGNNFTVTLTAMMVRVVDFFGQSVYSFVDWDWSEICSIPCEGVEVTEM